MIDQDFCDHLEYRLTKVVEHTDDEKAAFIGKTGQDRYELTIRFGNKALRKYARGLDIARCIPGAIENANWFTINFVQQKLTIQLD